MDFITSSESQSEMEILLVGISHRTAPVEIREKLACPSSRVAEEVRKLLQLDFLEEVVLLSTCNRVEVVFVSEKPAQAGEAVRNFLSDYSGMSRETLDKYLYAHMGINAVLHVFRVASSLDSMVLGEPQILGQVKESYRLSSSAGGAKTLLNRLFHKAFKTAKRVRNETRVGAYAVSVSSTAVELAGKIFGELTTKSVLLVGAGNMGELTARHLLDAGVAKLVIMNRTFSVAERLAEEFHAVPAPFEKLEKELVFADIVIGASGAPYPIITKKLVQSALKARKNKPMFFIDIAVPRDVEPAVNDLDNAYVYDIDDLQAIADEHLKERKAEALKAEDIVKEEAEKFESWRASLEVVPTIVELRNHFENVAKAELEKALASLPEAGEKERNALELLAHNIVNKLLHEPTVMLKKCTEEGERRVASACRKLFCLEVPESTESTENNEDEDDDDRQ